MSAWPVRPRSGFHQYCIDKLALNERIRIKSPTHGGNPRVGRAPTASIAHQPRPPPGRHGFGPGVSSRAGFDAVPLTLEQIRRAWFGTCCTRARPLEGVEPRGGAGRGPGGPRGRWRSIGRNVKRPFVLRARPRPPQHHPGRAQQSLRSANRKRPLATTRQIERFYHKEKIFGVK